MKKIILSILLLVLVFIPLCTDAKTVTKKYNSKGQYQGKYVTNGNVTKVYKKNGNFESKYVKSNGKVKHISKTGKLIESYNQDK